MLTQLSEVSGNFFVKSHDDCISVCISVCIGIWGLQHSHVMHEQSIKSSVVCRLIRLKLVVQTPTQISQTNLTLIIGISLGRNGSSDLYVYFYA